MTLKELLKQIEELSDVEGIETELIGLSTFSNPIYAFHVGNKTGKQVLMEGGIHAREYLSTLFLIEEIKFLAEQFKNGVFDGGFYVVPLVNPEGVGLVLDGLSGVNCKTQQEILKFINNNSEDFSLWKANGTGVDLNVNFNAEWGKGSQNVFCPNFQNFVGFYPESEREVNVLINFAKSINFDISLSWHTKGEVIYYGFYTLTNAQIERDYNIAVKMAEFNGYKVVKTEGSVGGFSDWVSLNYGLPAFTIELGNAMLMHPLGVENLPVVFEQNKYVPIVALNSV